jgi:hypothetical protein
MASHIGEASLGAFARRQLDAARRDPRLDRTDNRAMVADFCDALEEAERVRTLGLMGLHELTLALQPRSCSSGLIGLSEVAAEA